MRPKRFMNLILLVFSLSLCGCSDNEKTRGVSEPETVIDNEIPSNEHVIELYMPTSEDDDPGIKCPYIEYEGTRFYLGQGFNSFCEYGGEDFLTLREAMSVIGLEDKITSYGEWYEFIGAAEQIGVFESEKYYLENVGEFSTETRVYRISDVCLITASDYLKSLYAVSASEGEGSTFLEQFNLDDLTENEYISYSIWQAGSE